MKRRKGKLLFLPGLLLYTIVSTLVVFPKDMTNISVALILFVLANFMLYRGKWNLFDQIVLSSALLKKKGLKYDHNEVFIREYLFQQDGKYKGSPLRTHGGKLWLNGYSDHLPTIIYLKK